MDYAFRSIGKSTAALIVLSGPLDRVAAVDLKARVRDAVANGWTQLVVDLGAVSSIDTCGIEALVGALRATRCAGGDFRLARPTPAVRAALAATRMNGILCAHDTIDDAFGAFVRALVGSGASQSRRRPVAPANDVTLSRAA